MSIRSAQPGLSLSRFRRPCGRLETTIRIQTRMSSPRPGSVNQPGLTETPTPGDSVRRVWPAPVPQESDLSFRGKVPLYAKIFRDSHQVTVERAKPQRSRATIAELGSFPQGYPQVTDSPPLPLRLSSVIARRARKTGTTRSHSFWRRVIPVLLLYPHRVRFSIVLRTPVRCGSHERQNLTRCGSQISVFGATARRSA